MTTIAVFKLQPTTVFGLMASMCIGLAQSTVPPGRGFSPSGSYNVSDSETVNTVNGNILYSLPLVSLPPGRAGHSAGIGLIYNSQVYDIVQDYSTYAQSDGTPLLTNRLQTSSSGGGWQYSFNYGLELTTRPNPTSTWTCNSDPTNWRIFKLTLLTPEGGRHALIPRGYQNDSGDGYYEIYPNGTKSPCAPNQVPATGTIH